MTSSPESPKRHNHGFLGTVSAVMARLGWRASRLSKKSSSVVVAAAQPKKLLSNISNKTLPFKKEEEEWGDGGVWQKSILMGDKCQPLDFSGVIYYDSQGRQMSEAPVKSPRVSPLPGYLTRPRDS